MAGQVMAGFLTQQPERQPTSGDVKACEAATLW